jgi:ribokinase
VLGGNLRRTPGGKGANQAVAAARAGGADTWFLGALGRDDGAGLLLRSLTAAGVHEDLVARVDGATGTALIWITEDGENTIIVAPGANTDVAVSDAAAARIAGADAVLAQLEIPVETVLAAARARRDGAIFVLNAAPSRNLPPQLWDEIDVLVVNVHEARDLARTTGTGTGDDVATPAQLAMSLLERVPAAVITLGGDGALVAERGSAPVSVAAPTIVPVDTTGAGDAFCGVLAAALTGGTPLADAARLASAAGALTATRPGAQAAVPTAAETAELARGIA